MIIKKHFMKIAMSSISGKQQWLLLLFIIAGYLPYANTLNVPFYLDDFRNIAENQQIRLEHLTVDGIKKAALGNPTPNRPVANLSFALNYYFDKYNIAGFHAINIAVHLLTGVFLFLLFKATLNLLSLPERSPADFSVAISAALLWLVHPVQTQSVSYLVQRMNSLAAMFFILAMWCYVQGRLAGKKNLSRTWFCGSVTAGLLAVGSKEIAATLPFFIILYEWYFFQNVNCAWLRKKIPLIAAALVFFFALVLLFTWTEPLAEILSAYSYRDFTLPERMLTEFRVLVFYLGLLLYPHPSRLNLEHDFSLSLSLVDPLSTLFSLLAILLLLGLAVYYARGRRLLSFSILWFFGNLAIESTIIPLEIIFEHRLYLPSMFFCLCFVLIVFRYIRSTRWAAVLTGIVIVLFSFWTWERNSLWQEPVAFWEDAAAKSPGKARVHNSLAIAYQNEGLSSQAESAINRALALKPDFARAYLNLGNIYLGRGLYDRATVQYQNALRVSPGFADAFANLGNAYLKMGRVSEAIASYIEALKIKPADVRARVNLGSAYSLTGMSGKAVIEFEQALTYAADNPDIYFNLGLAYIDAGMAGKAVAMFEKVLALAPDDDQARKRLRDILAETNKL